MLDDQVKERLRTLTVEVVLAVRAEYLATPGVNVLKHWDQLQNRLRSAARTTATPEEWVTSLCRSLRLPSLHSASCSAVADLVHVVTEKRCADGWLAMIDAEYGWIMALARLSAEKTREARAAKETA